MSHSADTLPANTLREIATADLGATLRPLLLPIATPAWIFLLTLCAMLLRPPGPQFASVDRVAFILLVLVVAVRLVTLRERLLISRAVILPLSGLLLLSLWDLLAEPFDAQDWSLFAAKWGIPFVMFCVAGYVFSEERSQRAFETFSLLVLAYLSFIAVAFLLGAQALICPRFILDPSLGIHTDRARGPFLQAVANGVTLNMLGLIALAAIARGRLRGVLASIFLVALPLAILATKTRSVWVSFAGSLVLTAMLCKHRRLRRICTVLTITLLLAGLAAFFFADANNSFQARLFSESPVDFRVSVYHAGWQMFLEKPLTGWGLPPIQAELARRISSFRVEAFFFHNTYLQIAVERGLFGLFLYLWVMFDLLRLARSPQGCADDGFLGVPFRRLWPLILMVYMINASFVGMNYQFVNGLLFTLAGMLSAENRRLQLRVRT